MREKSEGRGLPESSASFAGASGGSLGDASMADLKRGYIAGEKSHEAYPCYGGGPWCNGETESGDTFEGDPRARGGFLTRPQGEER